MNLTPRAKFQAKNDQLKAHLDLVVNDGFRNACEAALIEQVLAMSNVANHEEAAAGYYRIMGATEYMRRLLSIGESTPPPKDPPLHNLNFKA